VSGMATDDSLTLLREIKTTLKTVQRILEIQSRPALKAEINALASSSGRRKMWILSDGETKTADLAKKSGLKVRAAEYFVEDGVRAGLLALPSRGCPKRAIDFIPEDWEELSMVKEKPAPGAEAEQQPDPSKDSGGAPDGQS